MNINDLPPELLVRIFSNIDDFSEKIALERVCRHWCQIVPLDWKITKTCRKPLVDQETFDHVMNRCGEWLEELWFQNDNFTEESVNRIHQKMKCLKHLKLSKCKLDEPAVNSIANLLGQKLYSFILDGTAYLPNMRRLIENEFSKLEHLQIHLCRTYSAGTLPTKLPTNLKSFSLRTSDRFYMDSLMLMNNVAKNCKNLKIFHLETYSLTPNMIMAIAGIKSLVYLNLAVSSIQNEDALQNVICRELPDLKALNIDYCEQETVSNICRDRPDLIYLNVFAWHPFQISESLNSLNLRIENPRTVEFGQFLPGLLFEQQKNVSIQHLDIRELILPSSSNFIKLLGQFPNLKTIHCKLPSIYTDLTIFFSLIGKHLQNGRNITIYFHDIKHDVLYYKYILPYDFPQFKAGWRPKLCNGKCENFVLKKLIKKAIARRNEPSFLDEYWME